VVWCSTHCRNHAQSTFHRYWVGWEGVQPSQPIRGKEEVGLGKLNESHSPIPLRWECRLKLELLVGEEEVGLVKLHESHSTIPFRWECGLNLELLVGKEEEVWGS
jgi:hypothetical protein